MPSFDINYSSILSNPEDLFMNKEREKMEKALSLIKEVFRLDQGIPCIDYLKNQSAESIRSLRDEFWVYEKGTPKEK